MSEVTKDDIDEIKALLARIAGSKINRAQLLERLDVCDKTLRNWIQKRQFPCDVGGQWILQDVMDWEKLKALGKV